VITYRMGRFEAHGPLSVATLRRYGLVHIPEDRLRSAGVTTLPLAENWMLTHLADPTINRAGWLTRTAAAAAVANAIDRLGIRASGPESRLGALSGGNQQKFVIARELAHRPSIVLAANPTRGLDLKTIADVEALLLAARDEGACVLWLTGDLSEMWGVADRVLVVAGGKVRGPVDVASTTQAEVGHWMTAH
jgi:simple sugar transport system ATP-binding protein